MSEPFPPPEDDAKKKKPRSVGHGLDALAAHPLAGKSAEANEEEPPFTEDLGYFTVRPAGKEGEVVIAPPQVKIDDYSRQALGVRSSEDRKNAEQRSAYEERRADHEAGITPPEVAAFTAAGLGTKPDTADEPPEEPKPVSLETLKEETPVHDSKAWTDDSTPEQYAQEYQTLKETLAGLLKKFPEVAGKTIEKGTEKFKAYSGYFSAKRAGLGAKIKERLQKLGVDIKEDVKAAAKGVAHVATHPGEVWTAGKTALEKTKAYATFLASEEAALYGRTRILFEDARSTMLAAGEWYRKQPMRRKMFLAGALASAGLATGGTAAFYAVSGVSAISRFLSGSAGYVTMEALIEKGIAAYEEKHGKAPEERSKILSGGKHAIALLAGLAVGSGALGRGLGHLGKAGFEEIGGDDAVKWLEGMWAAGVAEAGSAEKIAEHALHSASEAVGHALNSAEHAAGAAALSAEHALQDAVHQTAPLPDHVTIDIAPPSESAAVVGTETPSLAPPEVGGVEEVVVTAHAPVHFAPVPAVAGRGYEQMLLGLKAQALAHKAEILAAHGGDMNQVPQAMRQLLTEKVHVIASEGGLGHDVALGSKLSLSADGSHFTIDTGHGPTDVPHTAPVPEARPESVASAHASKTAPPAPSQEKIVDDLTRWHVAHPEYGDAPVQVNADGSIAPMEGAEHTAPAPEQFAPEVPTTAQPPTGEEIADKLTAWHAAHPGMENAQLQFNSDGTITPVPSAEHVTPAPSAPQGSGAEGAGTPPHPAEHTVESAETSSAPPVPGAPFENMHGVRINPAEAHTYSDVTGKAIVYGDNSSLRLAEAEHYAQLHKGVTVFLKAPAPTSYFGKLVPWTMRIYVDPDSGQMLADPEPISDAFINVEPDIESAIKILE